MKDGILVLFPGALGDFVCFLPALAGLLQRHGGPLTLVAKPELCALLSLPEATFVSIDNRLVADLYSDGSELRTDTRELLGGRSLAYSWTGANVPSFATRLAAITAGPAHVFPFRGMQPDEHAADYYARCAGVAPLPCKPLLHIDTEWFTGFQRRHDLNERKLLVLHPGSGSPAKNWTGFGALARRWQQRWADQGLVVMLQGPVELESPAAIDVPGALTLRDLTLPQVAALLDRCDLYAGNDSGISHLAGAVGAVGAVLFGSSDPTVWAPRGELTVLHAPEACHACGASTFCTHRLDLERVDTMLSSCLR